MALLDDILTHIVEAGYVRTPRLDGTDPINGRPWPAYLHMVDGNYILLYGLPNQPICLFYDRTGAPAGDGLVPSSIGDVESYIANVWPELTPEDQEQEVSS